MQQRAGATRTNFLGGLTAKKWGRSRPICPFLRRDFRGGGGWETLHRMNSVGRALGEEVAVLKVQRVILTVFTLFTLFLHRFRPRIRRHTRAKHGEESPRGLERPQASLLATEPCAKVGSLQPNTVFCPRPNWSSRHAQPLVPWALARSPR